MKKLLIPALSLLSISYLFSQNDTTVNKSNDTIVPVIKKLRFIGENSVQRKEYGNKTTYFSLALEITKNDTTKAAEINVTDEFITASPHDCFLPAKTIKINPGETRIDTVQILIGLNGSQNTGTGNVVYKIAAASDNIRSELVINIFPPNNPHIISHYEDFLVTIGANFDFAEGLEANSLYAKVSVFRPNLTVNQRIGIYTGLYQNNFFSIDSSTLGFNINYLSEFSVDSISFVSNRVSYKSNNSSKNLSLFISIPVRLTSLGSSFNLYFAPEFELLKVNNVITRQYQVFDSDTFLNKPWAFYRGVVDATTDLVNINQDKSIEQSYIKNFGLASFILTYENERNMIFLSGTLWGIGKLNNGREKSFYQYKFEIVETKYGISLGGEFRGFYGENPFISIHLSKLFNLSKLIDFQ